MINFGGLFTVIKVQPIAHARLGHEVARPGRIRLEFAAQLVHVLAQVVGLREVARPPHLLQELALAHELARVSRQHLKQLPLRRSEMYRLGRLAARDRSAPEIDVVLPNRGFRRHVRIRGRRLTARPRASNSSRLNGLVT